MKWVITTNHTPPAERFLPNGAATFWNTTHTIYPVTTLPGNPTSGIDFNTRIEFFDNKGNRK